MKYVLIFKKAIMGWLKIFHFPQSARTLATLCRGVLFTILNPDPRIFHLGRIIRKDFIKKKLIKRSASWAQIQVLFITSIVRCQFNHTSRRHNEVSTKLQKYKGTKTQQRFNDIKFICYYQTITYSASIIEIQLNILSILYT